jgi:hypothetical protein
MHMHTLTHTIANKGHIPALRNFEDDKTLFCFYVSTQMKRKIIHNNYFITRKNIRLILCVCVSILYDYYSNLY